MYAYKATLLLRIFRNQVRLTKHPDLIRLIRLFHQYFLAGDNVDSGRKIFNILS